MRIPSIQTVKQVLGIASGSFAVAIILDGVKELVSFEPVQGIFLGFILLTIIAIVGLRE